LTDGDQFAADGQIHGDDVEENELCGIPDDKTGSLLKASGRGFDT
jgi:hypothetical protein